MMENLVPNTSNMINFWECIFVRVCFHSWCWTLNLMAHVTRYGCGASNEQSGRQDVYYTDTNLACTKYVTCPTLIFTKWDKVVIIVIGMYDYSVVKHEPQNISSLFRFEGTKTRFLKSRWPQNNCKWGGKLQSSLVTLTFEKPIFFFWRQWPSNFVFIQFATSSWVYKVCLFHRALMHSKLWCCYFHVYGIVKSSIVETLEFATYYYLWCMHIQYILNWYIKITNAM